MDTPFPPVANLGVMVEAIEDSAEIRDGRAVVRLSRTEAGLAVLRAELAGKTYDLATTRGDKDARSDRLRCVNLRSQLEARRKALKAPALEYGKLLDAEAKRPNDEILLLEGPIDSAIKADEARREAERAARQRAEEERRAKLAAGVRTILNYITLAQAPGMTAERIAKGLAALNGMAFGDDWQEYRQQAIDAKNEAVAALTQLYAGALEREAEAARLEAERAKLEQQRQELAAATAQVQDAQAQDSQQVSMAEPVTADATDRGDPATVSPGGCPTVAGQPAAAGPIDVMKMSDINARLEPLKIDGAGVESLGFKTAKRGPAVVVAQSDWPLIVDALLAHLRKVAR